MSFICSLIANRNKVVLAEHSEYSGNFSQISRIILAKILKEGIIIIIMISKYIDYKKTINIDIKYNIYMKIVLLFFY